MVVEDLIPTSHFNGKVVAQDMSVGSHCEVAVLVEDASFGNIVMKMDVGG